MELKEVMRDRFQHVIEEATGRRMVGFMSGNLRDSDMICEVFLLAPTELFGGVRDRAELDPSRLRLRGIQFARRA